MFHRVPTRRSALIPALALALGACSDPTASPPLVPTGPQLSAVKFWEAGSSVAWNRTAREIITARGGGSPGSQSRILTYLSVAQYNAIVAAEDAKERGDHASPAAAAAGASVVVLKSFFPLDGALLDARLLAQRAAPSWPGERNKNFAAGETIGRAIGALVVAYAATDRVNLTTAPANPGGPGSWTGVNSGDRVLWGADVCPHVGRSVPPGPAPGVRLRAIQRRTPGSPGTLRRPHASATGGRAVLGA